MSVTMTFLQRIAIKGSQVIKGSEYLKYAKMPEIGCFKYSDPLKVFFEKKLCLISSSLRWKSTWTEPSLFVFTDWLWGGSVSFCSQGTHGSLKFPDYPSMHTCPARSFRWCRQCLP